MTHNERQARRAGIGDGLDVPHEAAQILVQGGIV